MFQYPKRTVVALLASFMVSPTTPAASTSADRLAGARLAGELCAACHTFGDGDETGWGPDLDGIVDRPVGAEEGYRYGSYLRAQQAAGATWDEAALRAWLVDSKAIARAANNRTKMPAQRLTTDQLDDLMSYLRTLQ
ncbi:MAG: c-type cytochrome [Myxococcota bacterium]